MQALVSAGGYNFPEPSTYSATTSTIVDSARNTAGYVVGNVIRSDVAKIELTWKYLTVEQWANILSVFSASFYADIRFFNQVTGNFDVRTMYVSDRTAAIFRRNPETGAIMGYTSCALSLVEV